jgi:hypothetical protein
MQIFGGSRCEYQISVQRELRLAAGASVTAAASSPRPPRTSDSNKHSKIKDPKRGKLQRCRFGFFGKAKEHQRDSH